MCSSASLANSSFQGRQEKVVSPARRRLSALGLVQDGLKACRSAFQSLRGMMGSEFLDPLSAELLEGQRECLERAIASINQCIELETTAFGEPEALPAAAQAPGSSSACGPDAKQPNDAGQEEPAFRSRDDPLARTRQESKENDLLIQGLDLVLRALKAMAAAWSQDPAFKREAAGNGDLLKKQEDLLATSMDAVGRARELALAMKELLADAMSHLEAPEKAALDPDTFLHILDG